MNTKNFFAKGMPRASILASFAAVFVVAMACIPYRAQAASLYFESEGSTVGVGVPFKINALVDAPKLANAFNIVINVPQGVSVRDSSDGNSIVTYWIQRPTFDQNRRTISFSGIVPGGFSGIGGTLASFTLAADRPGKFSISYASATEIILNSPTSDQDIVSMAPVNLVAEMGKESVPNIVVDNTPPEPFTTSLATSDVLFNGRWMAYFQTTDKGSGMYGYEAAEAPYLTEQYDTLAWHPTESPYLIGDQTRMSYLYIRATDKMGNSRVEVTPPIQQSPWQTTSIWSILISISVILAFAWFLKKSHSYRSRSSSHT